MRPFPAVRRPFALRVVAAPLTARRALRPALQRALSRRPLARRARAAGARALRALGSWVLCGALASGAQELAPAALEALARIERPTVLERERAQADLASALRVGDARALAAELGRLAPEGRARVAEALDARERLLPLAAELLGRGAAADEVALLAIELHLERTWPGLRSARLGPAELAERVTAEVAAQAPPPVQLPRGLPLAALADVLAAALPSTRLVVDPRLERRLDVPGDESDGWWVGPVDGVLFASTGSRGLELDAAVREPLQPLEPPLIAYLRITSRAFAESLEPRAEISGWIAALENPSPSRARAAAEALAHCGWPGGIAILQHRVLAGDDTVALPALVTAASRGRVASCLRELEVHRKLVAGARASFAAGGSGQDLALRRLLGALGQIGPVGAEGLDLFAESLFLEPLGDPAALAPDALALERLRLEAARRSRASRPALDARTAKILAEPRAPLELRRSALACAAVCRSFDLPPVVVAEPRLLLSGLVGDKLRAVTLELIAVADPGPALELAPGAPRELGALLAFGAPASPERAAELLAARLVADPGSDGELAGGLGARLDTLEGGLLDRLCAGAGLELRRLDAADPAFEALQRLRLRLGRAPGDEHRRLLDALGSEPDLDPRLLAALLAGPVGSEAQARLLARVALELNAPGPRPRAVLESFQEALADGWRALDAAGLAGRTRSFAAALRDRARSAPAHPLSGWLTSAGWPPPPPSELATFEELLPGLP